MKEVHILVEAMGILNYDQLDSLTWRGLVDHGGILTFQDPDWDLVLDHVARKGMDKLDGYIGWGGWYKKYWIDYIKKNLHFDSGELEKVTHYLGLRGYKAKITDKRVKNKHFIADKNSYTLWKIQEKAVQSLLSYHNGLCVLPPASGKTIIMGDIIRRLGHTAIILCHRRDIMYSNKEKLELSFPDYDGHIGVIGDGNFDLQPLSVGMIQTFVNHLAKMGRYRNMKGERSKIKHKRGSEKDKTEIDDSPFNYFSSKFISSN